MITPDDLLYTESHEWIRRECDNIRVGITDHAQSELSNVIYVELPKLERHVNAKEPIAVVESVKAASDICAPVKGTVVEANKVLEADPGLINREPYAQGWMFVLKMRSAADLKSLKNAVSYRKQIEPANKVTTQAPASAPPRPVEQVEPEKAIALQWSVRLWDTQLSYAGMPLKDEDYSGGSYSLTHERRIEIFRDHQFRLSERTFARISVPGVSTLPPEPTTTVGTWKIEVVGRAPYLRLDGNDGSTKQIRVEEYGRCKLLLGGKAYTWSKLR